MVFAASDEHRSRPRGRKEHDAERAGDDQCDEYSQAALDYHVALYDLRTGALREAMSASSTPR
ncbi:hypothetical protein [Sandaracinus amylolyticus]|uniref:Uncharacterized protein n=1 Tax=Sandaracinus amylolyticus TaxID=927083 RepID=A0A0F6SE48_9BACT|nr:hypothetical protein [Sandaracinus amylolyticus]AKF04569.1 hypothetical protein DB32_001718 [Sandaracinus amylolyticus]